VPASPHDSGGEVVEPEPLRGRPLLRRWVRVTGLGEIAGFSVPAVVGALVAAGDAPALVALCALVLAGTVEGAVLGAAQALVLRRALPAVPSRAWIGATAAGAALSYLLALLPSHAGLRLTEWPPAAQVTAGALVGAAFLLALAGLQWRVLRGHVPHAGRWIAYTSAAWIAGLSVFMAIATPLWHEGQPLALIVLIGVAAGVAMAYTVAAITGVGLVRLTRRADSRDRQPTRPHRRHLELPAGQR
jgi:hypothetical protein